MEVGPAATGGDMWKGIVGRSFTTEGFDVYVKTLFWKAWKPEFVVLHNTGIPTLAQWHDVDGHTRMKNLEHYYRDVQKWSAGPHLFCSSDWIWVFTPLTVPGVHSPSWNEVSLGVEMTGNFTKEPFNSLVRDNTVSALASLHAVLGIDSHSLKFHKDDPATTHKDCPGIHVNKVDMIQRVHNLMVKRKIA